ncbi:MAG: cytochrome b/b6 domain-containing protein [Candidatus Accumulibacter sp.]|jgi:cytochrome b|uniref:cytochrome b/b6 domain-containing protein n=1 Tax=Candidatus Accumulibacter TaxID=327159 RepID=UPI00207F4BB6|nr:cytochrome b/b6 domain-containing protein [Accumulibacter sp.]MBK8113968.1 cytochrome b/b6 domain-containing protein [Accumulibacter sp.]MBK8577893.1 cytochrome b/b6 domain-containing protein [Candidatus Accumulibacter propinquus]
MSAIDLPEIPVWDPLVRVFHWTLVISFCAAYLSEGELFEALQDRLSGEWLQLVHVWAGYLIAGLLLWRVVWGFVGPRHARFSDFVRGPRESFGYLKDALTLRAARYLGHNPAGGAMIVALLLSLAATIVTGLALYGADKAMGPLAALLVESSDATIDAIKEAHEAATNCTLLLVAGHLLGVVWESLLHRENLVRAMISGRKRA